MSLRDRLARLPEPSDPARMPIARRPRPELGRFRPTWREARPARIAAALQRAQRRDPGGWYVVGASADVGSRTSLARTVAGREVALWRAGDGSLRAGPATCPHLGALLDGCPVLGDDVVCRWHGLALGDRGHGAWQPFPAIDDGVLLWVRLPAADLGGSRPVREAPWPVERPPADRAVAAVITRRGRCEPEDVIANRLDPWHGAWFHPYAFSHLEVDHDASTDDRLLVEVTFRLGRTWGVPVQAEFVCPDARTIVMRIVAGEGLGSVVETHATPVTAPGAATPWTVVTEATIAHSDRPGFAVARAAAPLVRPWMRRIAGRLWVDDLAYAERRFTLRARGDFMG